ncbi:HAD family phosphatase [Nonomuraea sp. KC401]|uniref:HAD family hydrolase n=1 Tax=unclassified Nonomuraea TaxID=2593643 RepID=UPI0010FDE4DB|nr:MULTISPECIES: HAD family phosphatase [unclassified Nonomuraea]NBE94267.1 HAD-IA family hydrolase [Nonomuraea sp. K271]TLF66075.1 HAD family phosphatase [Nonomuraea sp. KC401]
MEVVVVTGVLIDWGGVLTTSMSDSIGRWIREDRIDADHYYVVMREMIEHAYRDGGGENTVHALERGELDGSAFERDLAARLLTLDGVPPVAEGLLERMFAGFERVEAMYDMLRDVRKNGLKTCLLSNSWGNAYPRDGWDVLFDAVVISGEVGMRKPEPRIFHHALDRIGLAGEDCVFIDDIEANILAARALGIAGIHHRDADTTIAELETLLRLTLRRA